jgi:predicted ATPase
MAELARFQNFAKLKDTSVEFNDITVLAGKPGTGKSYVMKMMYAIYESAFLSLSQQNENRKEIFEKMHDKDFLIKLQNKDKIFLDIDLDEVLKSIDKILNNFIDLDIMEIIIHSNLKNILLSIFSNYNQISNNFKINYIYSSICLDNSELNIELDESDLFNSISNTIEVIFVETPLILEFKKFMNRERGKTPYHIESLLNILDTDYSFTDGEQDKFIKNFREKSQTIIGGDIESSGDSFIFNRKDDKNYDILNASSGTKSIGLLQYLVTNKALKKGSILFWEEPEVHLHPTWQLKMVDLFIELMNAGVKIVFSTHSPYMADYLNAISKRNGYRERISFNVLDEKDGVVTNHILDDDNWDILQKELMDTFEDILWQYL